MLCWLTDDRTCSPCAINILLKEPCTVGPHLSPLCYGESVVAARRTFLSPTEDLAGEQSHPKVSCQHLWGKANPSSDSHRASYHFWNTTPTLIVLRKLGRKGTMHCNAECVCVCVPKIWLELAVSVVHLVCDDFQQSCCSNNSRVHFSQILLFLMWIADTHLSAAVIWAHFPAGFSAFTHLQLEQVYIL